MPTLHVYLDESGDLNFTPNGTKYYVFSAAWTYDPAPLAQALQSVRFGLLKAGVDLQSFHAAEDQQVNRNLVVSALSSHNNWNFGGVIVEKAKVNPSVRVEPRFYPQFASMMLRFVFKGCLEPGTRQVLIMTDTIPLKKHQDAIAKAFKQSCRADLPAAVRFDIYHHARASNKWIQVADYCCWSIFRKWEKGDDRTYNQLSSRLEKTELDVLARGTTKYY